MWIYWSFPFCHQNSTFSPPKKTFQNAVTCITGRFFYSFLLLALPFSFFLFLALLLLSDIPTLDPHDSESLDSPINLDELNAAVQQLGKHKTPGLDGLTTEFFQSFWPILKDDFLSVLSHACSSGNLPFSLRRAIITLIPKKGDLTDIANWRPVSLLNTDYKIFAKLLANRLKLCINNVVHQDQSYCVPGRTINDNICLIKNVIDYSNCNNSPLAVVNLDQKKAFDNVEHGYLTSTMRAMGFGDKFISYINLLYRGAESLVKVCGSLTTPFPFDKGIRQGCPLSGLLYSIAIEPLLHRLRSNLDKHSFQLPGTDNYCSVTAYADDVTVFITSDSGFKILKDTYSLFSKSSAANLNTQKTQGLWVGSWARRVDQPLNFCWNQDGLTFLGVRLGNTHNFLKQNWSTCKNKLSDTLSKWKRLSSTLSYKGKILIANQLAASKLYHLLAVLSPPENVLNELQELLVDFVWSGKRHYVKKQILYQPPDKGGLGLVCLQARMLTYRMSTIQRLLNLCPHPAYGMHKHFLHQYKKLNFDLQLFQTDLDPKFFFSIPPFYSDLLRAWKTSGARIKIPPDSVSHVINMPVNSTLLNYSADDEKVCPRLLLCGIKVVRHLLHPCSGHWLQVDDLPLVFSTHHRNSLRLINFQLQRLQQVLLSTFPSLFRSSGLHISQTPLRNISSTPDSPTPFILTPDLQGLSLSSKALYTLLNKSVNGFPTTCMTHWHRISFFKNCDFPIPWSSIYKPPIPKKKETFNFGSCTTSCPPFLFFTTSTPTYRARADGAEKKAQSSTYSSYALRFNQRSTSCMPSWPAFYPSFIWILTSTGPWSPTQGIGTETPSDWATFSSSVWKVQYINPTVPPTFLTLSKCGFIELNLK